MYLLLPRLILVLVAFISFETKAIAQYVPPYTSNVVPVTKHTDASKPLYSVNVMDAWLNGHFAHGNYLIDIDAPFIWRNCTLDWNNMDNHCPTCTYPVSCEEYQCTEIRTSYSYPSSSDCHPVTNSSTLPGWGFCTCPVNVVDPINGACGQAMLDYDSFSLNASDGRNPMNGFYGVDPNAACAPSSMFKSFPSNVSGVMALSTSRYALPAFIYEPFSHVLGLCLPSSLSTNGVMFFGKGPYYLLPNSNLDLRSFLSYTPMLKQPNSFGYFISVKKIVIKNQSIDVSSSNDTTKLSTIEPYTILRTNIYKELVRMFSTATFGIPRVKPVAPFGICFRYSSIKHPKSVLRVPDVIFSLRDGKNWNISSSNSLIQVTKDVACLAFVDGGETSEHAIVIGTFQMEDNFLLFDLQNSVFGFSSSLLNKDTSCSNFNFTNGVDPSY